MAATDLYDQAVALLDACVDLLGSRAPTISYVAPGAPAFDCCPMLTVHAPAVGEGATLPQNTGLQTGHRHGTARVNLQTLQITIVRCDDSLGDEGQPPSPVLKQAVASEIMQDVWTLWNGLYHLVRSGELFSTCGECFFEGARVIDSQGMCVGWSMLVRVSIPGYDPMA